ncbi:hypothetical protein [Nocardia miyunensis]|uniref:hypothetical protein n=1 Tax=Nocardia miyunensis TaxID=282684 RepID=UPI00350E3935
MEYAVWSREIRDGQLIHHSDRGSTYTAIRFANRLADNGIAQSMGLVGDCGQLGHGVVVRAAAT